MGPLTSLSGFKTGKQPAESCYGTENIFTDLRFLSTTTKTNRIGVGVAAALQRISRR